VRDVAHVPAIILVILQALDEHVGDRHGQAVIEAKAALLHGPGDHHTVPDLVLHCLLHGVWLEDAQRHGHKNRRPVACEIAGTGGGKPAAYLRF